MATEGWDFEKQESFYRDDSEDYQYYLDIMEDVQSRIDESRSQIVELEARIEELNSDYEYAQSRAEEIFNESGEI